MKTKRGILRRALAGACLVAVGLSSAPAVWADDKKVAAQQLFDDANGLVKVGDYANACPKFDESQRLDPQIGTLFWLADCQEHTHKLASAWANFVDAAERAANAGKASHAKQAQERAAALKGRLCRMILVVSDEVQKTPSLEIRRDDTPIGAAQFGVPLPVDSGKHLIKVSAAGKRSWETTVEASGEGNTFTVTIPALKEEPQVGLVPSAAPSVALSGAAAAGPVDVPGAGRATAGLVIGGGGLVGLGVGVVLSLVSKSIYDPSNAHCNAASRCDAEGFKMRKDAIGMADSATVVLIAGGVLLAGGVTFWLTAPSKAPASKSSAAVVAGPGSISVVGSF
jgi:hypothetical protein